MMEFSIDIQTNVNGEITIQDLAKEYHLYIEEDVEEIVTSFDMFKYSESSTINTIVKVGIDTATLIDVLLNTHDEEIDINTFKVKEDGYYVIDHLILPNRKWYENASLANKQYYETIYFVDNDGKVYKEENGILEECTIKEVLERNIEGTTILKCKVDVFFTGNLLQCAINYCKRIFNTALTVCNPNNQSDIYARDFIWMTLNIIDYLIGFKLYMEALRILESFKGCGNFCKSIGDNKKTISCGCS